MPPRSEPPLRSPGGGGARPAGEASWESPEFRRAVDRVDEAFAVAWRSAGVRPTGLAPDLAVARRLSFAMTGSPPSLEEIRAFESLPPGGRVAAWTEHLLRDRRTADYLAERFARVFVGVEEGPFVLYRRHRLVSWLSDQLHQNLPYDEVVRGMITARGIWTSRPEVNFITVTVDPNNTGEGPDEQKLAGRVARAFLGVRLDCVQCHDDKFGGRWRQADFHQLASFFAGAELSMEGVRDRTAQAYEFRYLGKGAKEVVPPRVPFEASLLPGAGPPRERLAAWVTDPRNRAFARTLVNRAWALLFNQPMMKPVDSIPLDGPWPPGMEVLADDLVEHHFDLRRLLSLIAASRPFHLESASAPGEMPVTAAQQESFAAFPITRLRPEQVAGGVLQSASLHTLDARSHVLSRILRHFQEHDFVQRFGDLGRDEFEGAGGTIPQRLLLMNGKLVHERTREDVVMNASTRIGVLVGEDSTALESAYLAILTRRPTAEERQALTGRLRPGKGGRSQRMEDLYWTLLNSTEFSWNH